MTNYPTQLDEIDQWLANNFGILPGACSSTENLRHDTARMIAEALWPKKGHIADDSKKVELRNNSVATSQELEEAAEEYAYNNWQSDDYHIGASEGLPFDAIGHTETCFKAGATWQRKQDHDACYQCEKNYDNVFFKGAKHGKYLLTIEDIERLHALIYAIKNNKSGVFTFTKLPDEQYQEVLNRFAKLKK